jgi:hypothetical protein
VKVVKVVHLFELWSIHTISNHILCLYLVWGRGSMNGGFKGSGSGDISAATADNMWERGEGEGGGEREKETTIRR